MKTGEQGGGGNSANAPCLTLIVISRNKDAHTSNYAHAMTEDEYREIGRFIWKTYVPKSGQSDTVQGELLRANEKLRDECHRNGNINWDSGHELLADYILEILKESPDLTEMSKLELKTDIQRILDYDHPYTEDDLFDRVERKIFDWYSLNKEPIPRLPNPNLHR